MSFFESVTGAKIKDCIANEKITFVVAENDMGKAIGKNGANIRKMEKMTGKRIRLVEFSSGVVQFVKNMLYPMNGIGARLEGNIVIIDGKNAAIKATLIGRERRNINHINEIVKRYFDVEEVKVG